MYDSYVDETAEEVKEDEDKHDDVVVMEELKKVADSLIKIFNTEADAPGNHPELGFKVPILDLAVWMEIQELPAPWMDSQNGHSYCSSSACLPIGVPSDTAQSQGLEGNPNPAKRMVQQVFFEFYHKPTKPKRTILATAANPWQQKRTTLTQ